jgi:polyhydroxyalkanoate synthase subunit PhaC
MIVSPGSLYSAVSNVACKLLNGRLADLSRVQTDRVGGGSGPSVHRYRSPEGLVPAGPPVLLVPSPGAPARCFDLRRGGSLAEHVAGAGRLVYLLDEHRAGPTDPEAGLAEWVRQILPAAIRRVSRDAGGQPVQLVGWCLGGVLALLAAADDPGLPIASVAAIAPPTGARRTGPADWLAELERRLLIPCGVLMRIDDREHLAHVEAADHFAAALRVHPGRALTEPYAAFLGGLTVKGTRLGSRRISLARVGVPVLVIAGSGDRTAPPRAVRDLSLALRSSPQVRFEIAPGDHLGVLTGLRARATTWSHLDRWLDEGILRHGIRPYRREATATL